jgi:predicted extracellular nuclease
MFKNPSFDKGNVPVFDRPSLVLRAEVKNGDKTFPVTAIANHLKSLRGITNEKEGEGVRLKRKLQAEFMARFLQSRQTANPNERLVLAGDFNAFQFTDGLVDVIGAIKGKPAVKELVLLPTEDLITNDLTNLVDMISREQRYSYSFAGNAQVLDHVIVNQPLLKHAARFGYARINADFPEIYRNDPNRVERLSDHDAAVAYFSFEEVPQNTSSQNTKR